MLAYPVPDYLIVALQKQGFDKVVVDYVWIDGSDTPHVRSKNRSFFYPGRTVVPLQSLTSSRHPLQIPDWGYDGSSTNQAEGNNSDLVLKPIRAYKNPFRKNGVLVMCEVEDLKGTPHSTNHRADLRNLLDKHPDEDIWFGFEQEYTFMKAGRPLDWPERPDQYPKPQSMFYCGVGADEIAGRKIVEKHFDNCLFSGIEIFGTNAEVMLGQWEFQIGPEGTSNKDYSCTTFYDHPDSLTLKFVDDLWMARYILYRTAEEFSVNATLDVKPIPGDWNGAGCHTNFSTKGMRDGTTDYKQIIKKLSKVHKEHIAVYGHGLKDRLTGLHETCDINTFKAGASDRTASIRIPPSMAATGKGYLEDRRPGANCDPYAVAARIIKTILD